MKNNQTLANGATVTIYPTTTESTNYVVYLHGGGMIYGTKSDLPEELKELFTSNGYTVLALDYLLAPNTKIDHILGALTETFQLLNEEIIQNQPFGLCGRSAGGYLMLQLTKQSLFGMILFFLAICCIITVFSKGYCRTFTDYQKMGTGLLTHCQTKH